MSTFERFTHTAELRLNGTPATVFPLFGPIREKEWAEGWNPILVYSESPLGDHPGTIFTVAHENGHKAIWYVTQFDAVRRVVEYVCIMSQDVMKVVHVRCEPAPPNRTQAFVTYTYTALSAEGNTALAHLRHHHPTMVAEWEAMINRCL